MKKVLAETGRFDLRPDLTYARKEHLWLRIEGKKAAIGMEPLEIESKGAIVVVQFEAAGTLLGRGDPFGSMEAEKHVGVLRSPVAGRITAVNERVQQDPRLVARDPYGKGWMIEVALDDFDPDGEDFVTGAEAAEWHAAEVKRYAEEGWLAE